MDTRYCRKHSDHHARHGSYYKRSYTAAEIAPHRKRALEWLEANRDDPYVANAIQRVETLYANAGPHVEAFRLRGLNPEQRAKAAWARLRKANVDPVRVVAAWLAIELTMQADPQPELKSEFKRVQAAKLIHRMSSGTHKKWDNGNELHVYPRPRGQILRYLGYDLSGAAELLCEAEIKNLLEI
ncbi:hypothetical protein [Ahrensia marina]|uniref:hypothetical protein n=1 Tax=Ahrensia marina TaxID=1514904 RepID=UPI00191A8350|nr:hypothetical protein [Ahrensia marina]